MTEDETAFALMFLRNMDEKLDRFFEETRDWKPRVTKVGERPDDVYRRLDRIELRIDRIERRLDLDGAH